METLQRETVNNEMQKFKMSVTGSYSNYAMIGQIFEGVRIDKVPKGSLINSLFYVNTTFRKQFH